MNTAPYEAAESDGKRFADHAQVGRYPMFSTQLPPRDQDEKEVEEEGKKEKEKRAAAANSVCGCYHRRERPRRSRQEFRRV
jgi:hypothetical protein